MVLVTGGFELTKIICDIFSKKCFFSEIIIVMTND